jgi:hypothetical protein
MTSATSASGNRVDVVADPISRRPKISVLTSSLGHSDGQYDPTGRRPTVVQGGHQGP